MEKQTTKKFAFGKIIIAALFFAVISQIVHTIGTMLTLPFYQDPNYFSVWSNLMMPKAGSPTLNFMLLSFVFALINGLIFASIYALIRKGLPGQSDASKGLLYGLFVFLLAGIYMFFTWILLINLPMMLLVAWIIEALIIDLAVGLITAKIIK